MNRTNRLLLAMMPLVWMSGCTSGCVVSKHPISDEGTSIVERRLVGAWEPVDENAQRESSRFQIDVTPKSEFALLVKSLDPDDKGPPLEIIATELGKRRYLSVRGLGQEKRRDEWCVLEYEWLDDNSFRIRWMDPKVVADEVKEKRVKGRIEERKTKTNTTDDNEQKKEVVATDVYLEEPTDKLRGYVEKSGERLFEKKWMTYKRIDSK